jgi:hypothetical protein
MNGILGEVDAAMLRGSPKWTLRVVTVTKTDRGGKPGSH